MNLLHTSFIWDTAMLKESGFSLIELIITIVIIALATSIALPSYQQHVKRTHRADATAALNRLAAKQEQYFIQNKFYASDLEEIDITQTANNFYSLEITVTNSEQYQARAILNKNSPQKNDPHCTVYSIDSMGARVAHDRDGRESSDTCWQ